MYAMRLMLFLSSQRDCTFVTPRPPGLYSANSKQMFVAVGWTLRVRRGATEAPAPAAVERSGPNGASTSGGRSSGEARRHDRRAQATGGCVASPLVRSAAAQVAARFQPNRLS